MMAPSPSKFIFSLILSFCLLPSVAQANAIWDFLTDDGVDLVVKDPFVEMHTGPGRGFPVFHVIEKGEELHIFKQKTDWYKVETTDGIKGWVKRAELSKTLGHDGTEVDFSAPGWEDYVDRRWEFGTLGGRFENADSFTTYIGFHLTQNISTELKYTQTYSPIANNKLASINAVHKPFPDWKISPFFTIGTGRIKIYPSSDLVQTEERENHVYTVGAGTFVYISRRFLFRLEYNKHTLLTQREENEEVEEWKGGFSVFF